MHLIEITPEEIITLQIEYAYIFYPSTQYIEIIKFDYENDCVYYYEGEGIKIPWTTPMSDFTLPNLPDKELKAKLYIINEE